MQWRLDIVSYLIIYLQYSSGKTLVGIDKTECCVLDILHDIGYQMCTRECVLRNGECRMVAYNVEHLRCKLLNSTIAAVSDGSSLTSMDHIEKDIAGKCKTIVCSTSKKCIELLNSTECVEKDTPRDCKDLLQNRNKKSGIYVIYPFVPEMTSIIVLCDMDLNNGGYTVISKRTDGSILFNRTWQAYREGFGNLDTNFWIGNNVIHALSSSAESTMYIELTSHADVTKYAAFSSFTVASEADQYRLTSTGYYGTAGNSLSNCQSARFSTTDKDYDTSGKKSCAETRGWGGWWYNNCCMSHLTSLYCSNGEQGNHCIRWYSFQNNNQGMKKYIMLIRRND